MLGPAPLGTHHAAERFGGSPIHQPPKALRGLLALGVGPGPVYPAIRNREAGAGIVAIGASARAGA